MADIQVENETISTFKRKTRNGREIRYEMTILQQPQRARACGSGAKSSADRRPVDPPPVVQLSIFDGEQDITFSHMASFFLYTTLEPARAIAQPKGVNAPQQPPVLTGTPVAGMAYLDRPAHAGYFIFPDLSVRHEGRYRLSFNLFEEVKREEDEDAEPSERKNIPNANLLVRSPSNPYQLVHFRLEVKSEPFTVFSAKKFPGLTESTALSRTVAEQGCRVRIRRDVRIRVRKDKPSHDASSPIAGYAVENQWHDNQAADHTALEKARSSSNGSALSYVQPYPTLESRPTPYEQQYIKPEQQYIKPSPCSTPAAIPQQQQQQTYNYPQQPVSHINYNGNQIYQTPMASAYNYPAYPASQQPQTLHSRQNSSSSAQEYHQQIQPPYQPQHQVYPSPQYNPTPNTSRDTTNYNLEIERKLTIPTQQSTMYSYPQSMPRTTTPITIPGSTTSTTASASGSNLPSIKALQPLTASSPTSYDVPSSTTTTMPPTKSKRGYNTVFTDLQSMGQSTYGMRSEAAGEELALIETEDYGVVSEIDLNAMKNMLQYRRADGTRHLKQIPGQLV